MTRYERIAHLETALTLRDNLNRRRIWLVASSLLVIATVGAAAYFAA